MKTPLQKAERKNAHPAKECAYLSMFVALLIAVQLAFSAIPGVELVTVMLAAYSFAMGAKRGAIAAVAFSMLRQLVFGFFPTVLVLYLLYYPAFSALFGLLGRKITRPVRALWVIVAVSGITTACFTLIDNILTPLWYGYSERATELYFKASLTFFVPQVISAVLSVGVLFLPLWTIFSRLQKALNA